MALAANTGPATEQTSRGAIPSLQILRLLAALAVVFFHVGSGLVVEGVSSQNFALQGSSGVDVFFVLSGFIITYSTNLSLGTAEFIKRRIARIGPLYWFLTSLLILIAVAAPGLLNSVELSLETIWKSYLFIPFPKPNGLVQPLLFLGWTLSYEVAFYLVFAVSLMAGRYAHALTTLVIGSLVALGLAVRTDSVLLRFYTDPIMLEFLLGMLLYYGYESVLRQHKGSILLLLGLLLAGLLGFSFGSDLPRFFGQGLPALALVAGFLLLDVKRSAWTSLLVLLGNASYSLYLSHPYVLQAGTKVLSPNSGIGMVVAVSVVSVLLCLAVSVGLYKLLEVPAQRWLLVAFGLGRGSAAGAKAALPSKEAGARVPASKSV
jgi:exopolysaccharide production protein ExoZ